MSRCRERVSRLTSAGSATPSSGPDVIRRASSVCVLGVVVAAVAYGVVAACAHTAEEGLWLANSLPDAELRARYGFIPSPEWVLTLQRAAVRVNDQGSGAFVS